jgi:benzoyl-CoA reductase subunit C
VIRNLSGMWQILFKDKYVRYVDVPQNYQDEVGGVFYQQEMQQIRDDLGTDARQPDHRRRAERVDRGLQRQPPGHPRPLRLPGRRALAGPTSEVYLLLRAGMVLPVEQHTQLVRDYLAAAELVTRPKRDNAAW